MRFSNEGKQLVDPIAGPLPAGYQIENALPEKTQAQHFKNCP